MPNHLLVVESPAKGKTLKKYLGKDFQVLASYGHVRDLLPKGGAIEPEKRFFMHYVPIEKNQKHVNTIIKALKNAQTLYLATDPDREGEAIAWHLWVLLKEANTLKNKTVYRVSFNQITRNAVREAIENPRQISCDLVDAQQARRALDYLVGFSLSPLLWKKIGGRLSAGRVQTPALSLIVEREEAREAFKSQEYWTITAHTQKNQQPINARLIVYQNEKLTQFSITNEKQATNIEKSLLKAAKGQLDVIKVNKKQRKRYPPPPFTTSTLQQEAARKLRFGASRTMQIAQQLYEGIDIGDGEVGLISYMRTDSVNLANEAIEAIRQTIVARYGSFNLPDQPRIYKTKVKNAQEAHEAIRSTLMDRSPDTVKQYLNSDQLKLYTLIWQRTIACQMLHATIDTVAIDFSCGEGNQFRATGSTIANPGFMAVYQEGLDDIKINHDEEKMLPPLKEGEQLPLQSIQSEQHFTEPPPRYTEATLIKALEELGIGRPSTYASILTTIQQRKYALLDNKRFKPTDVGRVVNRFLKNYFTRYVDYDFTAKMENTLDAIANGENQWRDILAEFWWPFKEKVDEVDTNVDRRQVTQETLDERCPECQKPLTKRLGRNGQFIGCSGYPECRYTRNTNEPTDPNESKVVADRSCPNCQSPLAIKFGRYGKFIGCSSYPNCKYIEPLEKPKDTGIDCPDCQKAHLFQRKSRRGSYFYSCDRYPNCKYATWYLPYAKPCPKCQWPILVIKTTKRRGTELACPQKNCDFSEPHNDSSN